MKWSLDSIALPRLAAPHHVLDAVAVALPRRQPPPKLRWEDESSGYY